MATDNNMEYDEAQAVKFIRDYMPPISVTCMTMTR